MIQEADVKRFLMNAVYKDFKSIIKIPVKPVSHIAEALLPYRANNYKNGG